MRKRLFIAVGILLPTLGSLGGCASADRTPLSVLKPVYSFASDPLAIVDPFGVIRDTSALASGE